MSRNMSDPLNRDLLTVRALGFLSANGIKTLGDLLSYSISEYLHMRNCDKKILYEIIDYAEMAGHHLT